MTLSPQRVELESKLTPEMLRSLAKAHSPFWEGQARQALAWAGDVLEAAEAVIREPSP